MNTYIVDFLAIKHKNVPRQWPARMLIFSIWDKEFKNGSSKICGRQPLKCLQLLEREPPILLFLI